jgi:hypothetical protein
MKTTNFVSQAAADYAAAKTAFEAVPFDFASAMVHPEPPVETPEARAGAMVGEMGLTKALVRCVGMGLNGTFNSPHNGDWWRSVATYIIGVASEA